MRWLVTLQLRDAPQATVEVQAPDRVEAAFRAAYQVETTRGQAVQRVVACRKYAR